jgi:hypothetical protein
MMGEHRKGERVFLASLGVIVVGSYGYAFLFEVPGQVSVLGIIAFAAANACLLVIVAYVLLRWYQRRQTGSGNFDAINRNRNGT